MSAKPYDANSWTPVVDSARISDLLSPSVLIAQEDEYDGMVEDCPEDRQPQLPGPSRGVLEECQDGDSDSDDDTVTEEQCLEGMLSDEDLEDDVEQQPNEELLEELQEEHGTMHSPDRCGCNWYLMQIARVVPNRMQI